MSDKEITYIKKQLDEIRSLMLQNKEVLNIDEAATYTGLTKGYIYKLTSRRDIPFYKPNGRLIYFKKAELEEWLLSGRSETIAERDSRITTERVIKKRKVNNPRRSPSR